jgi:hypothetical protein
MSWLSYLSLNHIFTNAAFVLLNYSMDLVLILEKIIAKQVFKLQSFKNSFLNHSALFLKQGFYEN